MRWRRFAGQGKEPTLRHGVPPSKMGVHQAEMARIRRVHWRHSGGRRAGGEQAAEPVCGQAVLPLQLGAHWTQVSRIHLVY